MGLLQKATEQNLNSPKLRQDNFVGVKERLLKVKDKIELYPSVFKELVDLFSIEKGALLVKEGNIFSLSSIVGYDETTKHRLRISSDEYDRFDKTGEIDILQKYFSIREFVTTKKIYIMPFINNNIIQSLLLITEFKTELPPDIKEVKKYTKELENLFGENPLHRLKDVDTQNSDIKEGITNYLQKVKNSDNRVIFLKLNLNSLLAKFKESDSLSTTSSIKNSALKMLTSFSKNRGKVFQLYNNDMLLTLLDRQNTTNIMIIQQQINAAFKTIFSNKLDSVDLSFESLIWKNNSLDTILDHFIQDADS